MYKNNEEFKNKDIIDMTNKYGEWFSEYYK